MTIDSWLMTKTAGAAGAFDAGASSSTSLAGDGYVEVTATGSTGAARGFGFSATDPDQNYTSIKFCLYLDSGGVLFVFELGVLKFTGSYATNDVLRVNRTGTAVTYYKNGALQYTSATASSGAIVVDSVIRSASGTLDRIKLYDAGVQVPITWTSVVNVTMSVALAAATFETIRNQQCSLIEALTPTQHAGVKFQRHREKLEYMAWVEANPKACMRRFQILSNFDIEQGPTADGSIEACRHTMELRVAYPNDMGRYGAENERDVNDLLAADLHKIDAAIGLNGGGSYVANQDLCLMQSQDVLPAGDGARVLSVTYLVQYDRSV